MSFNWPWMLILLAVVPLLIRQYRTLLERRTVRRTELAAMGMVAAEPVPNQRRHVAPALLLGALVLLLLAMARPHATVARPYWEGTIVLAIDVSGSMAATDATPTRLESAKNAARSFVNRQPAEIRLGVVAFGGSGVITQRPTIDRAAVLTAIDRLTPQGDTGLGRGIQAALSAISGKAVRLDDNKGSVEVNGPDLGFFRSAAVLMMTDGENTAEPDPQRLAEVASAAGVRVYPIGFGTAQGTVLDIDGYQVATALDDTVLRQIAITTGGTYINAEQSHTGIDPQVPLHFAVRAEHTDVTGLFCLAAAVLLMAGAAISLAWFGRVI